MPESVSTAELSGQSAVQERLEWLMLFRLVLVWSLRLVSLLMPPLRPVMQQSSRLVTVVVAAAAAAAAKTAVTGWRAGCMLQLLPLQMVLPLQGYAGSGVKWQRGGR